MTNTLWCVNTQPVHVSVCVCLVLARAGANALTQSLIRRVHVMQQLAETPRAGYFWEPVFDLSQDSSTSTRQGPQSQRARRTILRQNPTTELITVGGKRTACTVDRTCFLSMSNPKTPYCTFQYSLYLILNNCTSGRCTWTTCNLDRNKTKASVVFHDCNHPSQKEEEGNHCAALFMKSLNVFDFPLLL